MLLSIWSILDMMKSMPIVYMKRVGHLYMQLFFMIK